MQMIPITDALDAMERNIKAFLVIAGETPGYVKAQIDVYSGTASISHRRDYSNGTTKGTVSVTVNFPAMESQTLIGKDELDRWTGYFIHELCHALYTDEQIWRKACHEGLNDLVNGMEDVRIEALFNKSSVAANSFELLNSLLAWCVGNLPKNYDPNDTSNLAWLFAMVGRVEICGYALPGAASHMAKLSPAMRRLCNDVMARLAVAKSTLDVLEIARDLQKRLSHPGKAKTNPGKTPGEGKSDKPEGDEGKAGEPEGNEGKAGEPEGDEGDEGDGKAGEPEGDEGDGKAGDGGAGAGDGEDGISGDMTKVKPVDISPLSPERIAEAKALSKNFRKANAEAEVIDSIRDAQHDAGRALRKLDEVSGVMNDIVAESMQAAKLRAQVARVLKAEENESWDRGRASGRLDRFALARIGAGHVENVFAKRRISGGYETEIDVLVDASGSMSGGKGSPMYAATVVAFVIAQAAQQVGVKCQVSRFTSTSTKPRIAKGTNESPSSTSVQNRFGAMAIGTPGSTPLSKSIIQVSAKLAARAPQKRKMLFVVSDGDCDMGPDAVRKACDYAERLDVETVALCIDTVPHDGFRLAVQCDSKNIAQAGLGVLVKALSREV